MAIEVLGIGVLFWILQLSGNIRYLRRRVGRPWSWFWPRAVLSQLATIPFCVAGYFYCSKLAARFTGWRRDVFSLSRRAR